MRLLADFRAGFVGGLDPQSTKQQQQQHTCCWLPSWHPLCPCQLLLPLYSITNSYINTLRAPLGSRDACSVGLELLQSDGAELLTSPIALKPRWQHKSIGCIIWDTRNRLELAEAHDAASLRRSKFCHLADDCLLCLLFDDCSCVLLVD